MLFASAVLSASSVRKLNAWSLLAAPEEAVLGMENAMIELSLVPVHLNGIVLVFGVITIRRPCPNLS